MTFNQNAPLATDKIRNWPSEVTTNEWPRLVANINADHQFQNTAGVNPTYGVDITGYHKVIHMLEQGSDPTTGTLVGALYGKSVGGFNNLFYRVPSSGQIIQITQANSTPSLVANNGQANLVGGLIMKWGFIAPNTSTTNTVTFSPAFPTNLFNVQVTRQRPTSDPGSSYEFYVDNSTTSTTGFNIINRDGHSYGYYWQAIGN